MTFKELEELLNKEFVGKKYDGYGTRWDIRKFIEDTLKLEDLTSRQDKQNISIFYKGYGLINLDVKKRKGEKHLGVWSDYFDWEIKEIVFAPWVDREKTIEDKLKEIDEQEKAYKNTQLEEAKKIVETMKMIKEAYNFKDWYDVTNLCKKIYEKRYSPEVEELLKEVE